ncbi:hypothetical protein AVEN_257933-1 [Araneus ventricosus]|uniref:Uncharacterized protein n=1 Tax=Araneus ventricosus TaxID=182803 RepID=A0A4Y2SJA4_ARAVE|nr:hypothetical protein AVEN_257933-1 [Araneus ventricosus]
MKLRGFEGERPFGRCIWVPVATVEFCVISLICYKDVGMIDDLQQRRGEGRSAGPITEERGGICRKWTVASDEDYFGPLPWSRSCLDFKQTVVNTPACFSIVPFFLPEEDGLFLSADDELFLQQALDPMWSSGQDSWFWPEFDSRHGKKGSMVLMVRNILR